MTAATSARPSAAPLPAARPGRLPPSLARRIDRLARRAHAFHRFAHHPLCQRYAAEVISLGRRWRVCRGCTFTAAGAIAGGLAGWLLPAPGALALGALAALLAAGAAWAVSRRASRNRPKLLSRLAPMALAAALLPLGLRAGGPAGLLAALCAAAAVAAAAAAYRRRGPDRAPCTGCPEAPASSACSGFRAIALRERAFARLAGRWIDRAL
jgi:hypothetical protein